MTTLAQGRLRAELHVLHVEEHALGAARVHGPAARVDASTTGRTASRTRRTSSTSTSSAAAAPAFEARLVLAATLSPSYGIYSGFEQLRERAGARRAREEYLDSEKYEAKQRDARRAAAAARRAAERGAAREPRAAVARQRRRSSRPRTSSSSPSSSGTGDNAVIVRSSTSTRPRRRRASCIAAGLDRPAAGVPRARPARRRRLDVAHRPQLRPARAGTGHVLEDRRLT